MANIKLKCLLIKFQKVVTRVGLHGTPVGFKLNSVIQFCAFLKNYFIFPILPSPTNGRPPPQPQPPPPRHTAAPSDDTLAGSFLRKLHEHVPDSSQLLGYLTLFVSSGVLLLTGLTVTLSVTGMIFLTPLIILTSPLWVPVAALVALAAAGVVSVGGFGFAALAGLSWLYNYFRGLHPLGLERTDYARDRIYDTARHVKDYAREYGEYLQTKLKDVAPDA